MKCLFILKDKNVNILDLNTKSFPHLHESTATKAKQPEKRLSYKQYNIKYYLSTH